MTLAVERLESVEPAPSLARDVELLGPYLDSGLEEPPYLIRRGASMLQVSHLLHAVAAGADGTRDFDDIAAVAAGELGRDLSGDDVRYLIDAALAPAGIVIPGGGGEPRSVAPAADDRLLALRHRRPLLAAGTVDGWARRVGPLFRPPVVAAVLVTLAAWDVWMFGVHGVGGALGQVLRQPLLLFFMLGLTCAGGVFHEFGHAGGCRYSGARPGAVGAGLYLLWPVLYTNVTDAYRLDRRGRLRTDLGGIYFNAVFSVVLAGAYVLTGFEPILAGIVVQHAVILDQLMPWVRFDGYYVVSDLTGVPDILGRVRPALAGLIPGREPHPDVAALRPAARRLLFAYLASLLVFVAVGGVATVIQLPGLLTTGWESLRAHLHELGVAVGRWDALRIVLEAVEVGLLAAPAVGLALSAAFLVTRRKPDGKPRTVPSSPAVRRWLDDCGLTIVDGVALPGGGAVDYLGFGATGEIWLIGAALDRPGAEVVARLLAAAGEMGSFTHEELDRLLLDGVPFVERVAGRARAAGQAWDEACFRRNLNRRLARREMRLVVLTGDDDRDLARLMSWVELGCGQGAPAVDTVAVGRP